MKMFRLLFFWNTLSFFLFEEYERMLEEFCSLNRQVDYVYYFLILKRNQFDGQGRDNFRHNFFEM